MLMLITVGIEARMLRQEQEMLTMSQYLSPTSKSAIVFKPTNVYIYTTDQIKRRGPEASVIFRETFMSLSQRATNVVSMAVTKFTFELKFISKLNGRLCDCRATACKLNHQESDIYSSKNL